MGNLPFHIYEYNNEHDVIVYTVVKDKIEDWDWIGGFLLNKSQNHHN